MGIYLNKCAGGKKEKGKKHTHTQDGLYGAVSKTGKPVRR